MIGLLAALMFVAVALLAFYVGRETGRTERSHAALLSEHLHPSTGGANVVDQPADEYVRRLPRDHDTDAPYDWERGDDEGDASAANGFGTT